ncbi:MAG: aminopeptidase [Candidatus Nanohaloarchaea archaeon]
MDLERGAETVLSQCMDLKHGETVLVLNDGNDEQIVESLLSVAREEASIVALKQYDEPERHGEEPPEEIAEAMKDFDLVVAPTRKSISHTSARKEACEEGARIATMPAINQEIWSTSLQADYSRVGEISGKLYSLLKDTERVRVTTPSGTDLKFSINVEYFDTDTGLIHEPGDFGNLPAGEVDGAITDAEGVLVIDHFPYAPEGTEVEIKGNEAVAVRQGEESELSKAFEDVEGSRKVAEFGIGTNPEATLIGKVLQDEKVLGTVHFAFGDNTSYVDGDESNECSIHWDTVCEDPTVFFDGEKVLDSGEPVFLVEQ